MKQKIMNWFYTTRLGNLYFDFLLWQDRRRDKAKLKFMSPKEIAQAVREYSLTSEGVKVVKRKINAMASLGFGTTKEYEKILSETELIQLAERDRNSAQAVLANINRQSGDYEKIKDIENDTDRAKMIDKRINDMYTLQDHVLKRTLLRNIRNAKKNGDSQLADQLEQEFKVKYGGS